MSGTVTIEISEYRALLLRDRFLTALEAAGVDNWIGYDEAQEIYRESSGRSPITFLTEE